MVAAKKKVHVSLGLDVQVDADVLTDDNLVEFMLEGRGVFRNQIFMRGVPVVDMKPVKADIEAEDIYLELAHGEIPKPITVAVEGTLLSVYEDDLTVWSSVVNEQERWFLPLVHSTFADSSIETINEAQSKTQLEPDPFDTGTLGLNVNSYQDALMVYRELNEPEQALTYKASYLLRE